MKKYDNIYTIIKENSPHDGCFIIIPNAALIVQNVKVNDIITCLFNEDINSISLSDINNNNIIDIELLEKDIPASEDIYWDFLKSINDHNAALIILDEQLTILKSFSIEKH